MTDAAPESVVQVDGVGVDDANAVRSTDEGRDLLLDEVASWPQLGGSINGDSHHPDAGTGRWVEVVDGRWKLAVTYGDSITYSLHDVQRDPAGNADLSKRLDNVVFRLRGVLERREGEEYRSSMRENAPGRQADRN